MITQTIAASMSLDNPILENAGLVKFKERAWASTFNWLQQLKYVWRWLRKLRIWGALLGAVRAVACVLFVSPPMQEQIEQARIKAIQYRGIF